MVDNQNNKAMKTVLLIGLALISAGTLAAQGSIKGNIKTVFVSNGVDSVEPLPNAEVYVMYAGSRIVARTSANGDYTLKPLEPGTYTVTIQSILIDTVMIPDVRVSGTEMTFAPHVMAPLGRKMKGIVVHGEPTLRTGNPSKEELRKGQLDKLPDPGNINTAIAIMAGGVYVSEDGRQISFRGARIGDALYVVDGVRQRGTDVSVPNGSIATINSWNGGVPAQYGDFTGGVVVIETMSYFDWENQQEVRKLIQQKNKEKELEREALKKALGSPEPDVPGEK